MSVDCLNNLIALTRSSCECFNLPEPPIESGSGIYIDEIVGGGILKKFFCSPTCGDDYYIAANKILNNALNKTYNDFMSILNANYKDDESLFKQQLIGKVNGAKTQIKYNYAGVQACFKDFKAGIFCIEEIGIAAFDKAQPTSFQVWDNQFCNLVYEFTHTPSTIKTTWHKPEEPIKIVNQKHDCYNGFYIIYEPKGCKVSKTYNWCKGCAAGRPPQWSQSLELRGYASNELNPKDCEDTLCQIGNTDINGILLKASFVCDRDTIFCCLLEDETFKYKFAEAAAYKAASMLILDLQSYKNLSYTTIADAEFWDELRTEIEVLYHSLLHGTKEDAKLLDYAILKDFCLCYKSKFSFKKGLSW